MHPFGAFAPPSSSPQTHPFSPTQPGVMSPSLPSAFDAPHNPPTSRSNAPSRTAASAGAQSAAGQMSNPLLNVCPISRPSRFPLRPHCEL